MRYLLDVQQPKFAAAGRTFERFEFLREDHHAILECSPVKLQAAGLAGEIALFGKSLFAGRAARFSKLMTNRGARRVLAAFRDDSEMIPDLVVEYANSHEIRRLAGTDFFDLSREMTHRGVVYYQVRQTDMQSNLFAVVLSDTILAEGTQAFIHHVIECLENKSPSPYRFEPIPETVLVAYRSLKPYVERDVSWLPGWFQSDDFKASRTKIRNTLRELDTAKSLNIDVVNESEKTKVVFQFGFEDAAKRAEVFSKLEEAKQKFLDDLPSLRKFEIGVDFIAAKRMIDAATIESKEQSIVATFLLDTPQQQQIAKKMMGLDRLVPSSTPPVKSTPAVSPSSLPRFAFLGHDLDFGGECHVEAARQWKAAAALAHQGFAEDENLRNAKRFVFGGKSNGETIIIAYLDKPLPDFSSSSNSQYDGVKYFRRGRLSTWSFSKTILVLGSDSLIKQAIASRRNPMAAPEFERLPQGFDEIYYFRNLAALGINKKIERWPSDLGMVLPRLSDGGSSTLSIKYGPVSTIELSVEFPSPEEAEKEQFLIQIMMVAMRGSVSSEAYPEAQRQRAKTIEQLMRAVQYKSSANRFIVRCELEEALAERIQQLLASKDPPIDIKLLTPGSNQSKRQ